MNDSVFPFSAIVGQSYLKLALMLCAIDPGIGGVLLSGARGSAKSTLARGLLALMPSQSEGGGRFVTLPLGVGEEHITGTLDLEKVLGDGSVDFSPGLLHEAHGGILYVDEVNLLADHLVDLLLDVAASGVNTVERDSISHRHPAEFLLVGTMNPEEGELRPQLLDRYGLYVDVGDDYSAQERGDIVRARLAYDAAPQAFIDRFRGRQAELVARCTAARERLPTIQVSDAIFDEISHLCLREGAEGVRADIAIHRAARAYAALEGRGEVRSNDVDAVAEFALAHRRSQQNRATSPPPAEVSQPDPADYRQRAGPAAPDGDGDWGALPPLPTSTGVRRALDDDGAAAVIMGKKKHR